MKRYVKRAWSWLTRTDVAALLILVLSLGAALGSCLPQLPLTGMEDAARLVRWQADIHTRYGALADALDAAGAFSFFSSPFFLVPLALLTLATLACVLSRWPAAWRTILHRRPVSFVSLVEHLAVLLLLAGVVLSRGLGWRQALTIAPGATAALGHGSESALRNDGFTIARAADGAPTGYEAKVTVLDAGREAQGTVRLNAPLAVRGVRLYLSGYKLTADGASITLLAARDPGYGVVIAGGCLLLAAMTVRFTVRW